MTYKLFNRAATETKKDRGDHGCPDPLFLLFFVATYIENNLVHEIFYKTPATISSLNKNSDYLAS